MHIRTLNEADLSAPMDWFTSHELRVDRWRDEETRAVVATDASGAVVGTGRFYMGRVHDSRLIADVEVAPEYRRQGLGTAIVRALGELRPDRRSFQAGCYAGSTTEEFLATLGATEYQRVPPEFVDTAAGTAALSVPGLPPTVSGDDVPWRELEAGWVDMYDWIHEGWSPVAPDFATWILEGFREELDRRRTRVRLGPDGTVRAMALVWDHPGPEPNVVPETRTRAEVDGERQLAACLRDAFAALCEDGVAHATIEGHVTDPHYARLHSRLPATGEPYLLLEFDPAQ